MEDPIQEALKKLGMFDQAYDVVWGEFKRTRPIDGQIVTAEQEHRDRSDSNLVAGLGFD